MNAEREIWELRGQPDPGIRQAAKAQQLSDTAADLLCRRLESPEDLKELAEHRLSARFDPGLLPDMAAAAAKLADVVQAGQRVLIFGDYDVDGTTSAAVLTRFLSLCGHGSVSTRLPHRLKDGYGIQASMVDDLAEAADLLITVDCGATAFDALERAQELGLEVIVCDHHTVAETVPPACAVINPKRADNQYPGAEPAAVGVAFNLVMATRRELRQRGFYNSGRPEPRLDGLLELVALGTVADMVTLTGINRLFTRLGLAELQEPSNVGLAALRALGRPGPVDEVALGFHYGPRINAAGRLDRADPAFELLVTEDPERARQLATQLDDYNRERRELQRQVLESAVERVRAWEHLPDVIILQNPDWHPGVVGIVASGLVRRFNRSSVVIGSQGKGSARAVEGQSIYAALNAGRGLLDRFGGHRAAAGLTFSGDREALAELRETVNLALREQLGPDLHRRRRIFDLVLHPGYAHRDLARELDRLGPWGQGNPRPVFLGQQLQLLETRPGKKGYLGLWVGGFQGNRGVQLFGFDLEELSQFADSGDPVDVLYELSVDHYRGEERARRRVLAWRPSVSEEAIAEFDSHFARQPDDQR